MITLTNPKQIEAVLGGSSLVNYDKLVLSPFNMVPHPTQRRIDGQLKLTSTVNPNMVEIRGTLTIDLATGILEVTMDRVDFYHRALLTAGQITSVQNIMNAAQNSLEAGLISIGVIAGTQSTGS
jgi:hypothetical protein